MFRFAKLGIVSLCLSAIMIPTTRADEAKTDSVLSTLSVLPDRRKEQFQSSPGYALFPYPYSLPGIGQGLSLVGGAMNIANTYIDTYGLLFSGDVKGGAVGVRDVHIVPRTLIFEAGISDISKAVIRSYSERGMNTEKDDYRLLEISDSKYYGGRVTATFLDRRFELFGAWYKGGSKLKNIRDKDGTVIVEAENASRELSHTTSIGTRIDLTDDYADPRRGVRLEISGFWTPRVNLALTSTSWTTA